MTLREQTGGCVGRKDRYLVGLDVGTSKVCAIVGELLDDGGLDVVGIGVAESRGIRRGVIVNLEAAVDSIKKAVDEAELMAGVEIDAVHLSMAGPHIKGFNSRGVIAVAGKSREITRDDVRRAIEAAKAVSLPAGREILHVLPQDFVVDEQDGIGAPVGMTGARLEVNVHIVTSATTATQNLVSCVNRAGVGVIDTVVEQIGAAEAVLTPDEKELGVALVDIGGGTTDIAIFERGSLWHTAVIGVGGDHFTSDIAVGLRMPIPDAEKLKRKCGCALSAMVDEDETIDVASVGGRRSRVMARRILSEILQPRAEEIFHLVWDEIRRAGYEKSLNSGIVLTGGGAILEGMPEIAEQIFDLADQTRRADRHRRACRPRRQSGLRDGRGPGALRPAESGSGSGALDRRGRLWTSGGPAQGAVPGVLLGKGRPGLRTRRIRMSQDSNFFTPIFKDINPSELRLKLDEDRRAGARIKVVGVGGGGSNAVARMVKSGFQGVDFLVANTDLQALQANPAPVKVQIGSKLTKGLGAGADPNVGRQAALEDTDKLIQSLDGADMVFVTTGLGGGTGTGAAPVIASLASELGALTIAVVTKPFKFEGRKRHQQAEAGLEALRECVDTVITIPNERLLAIIDRHTSLNDSFMTADDVLRQAIQGISDLILVPGLINLDFADVKTIMAGMGIAMMGTGIAEGENRAMSGRAEGDLQPAARRRVGRRRSRRDHQRHRRPGPVAARSERGVDDHPGGGPRRRQHHLRRGGRRVAHRPREDHRDRHRLRPRRRQPVAGGQHHADTRSTCRTTR